MTERVKDRLSPRETASVKLPSSSVAASEAPLRKTNAVSRAQAWCRKANQYASSMTRRKLTALVEMRFSQKSPIRRVGIGKIRPLVMPGLVSSHNCTTHPHAGTFVDIVYIYIEPAALPSRGNISSLSPKDRNHLTRPRARLSSSHIPPFLLD